MGGSSHITKRGGLPRRQCASFTNEGSGIHVPGRSPYRASRPPSAPVAGGGFFIQQNHKQKHLKERKNDQVFHPQP